MKVIFKSSLPIVFVTLFLFNNAQAQTKTNAADSLVPDKGAYDKVEVEASFPGGASAWTKYITREIMLNIDRLTKKIMVPAL